MVTQSADLRSTPNWYEKERKVRLKVSTNCSLQQWKQIASSKKKKKKAKNNLKQRIIRLLLFSHRNENNILSTKQAMCLTAIDLK